MFLLCLQMPQQKSQLIQNFEGPAVSIVQNMTPGDLWLMQQAYEGTKGITDEHSLLRLVHWQEMRVGFHKFSKQAQAHLFCSVLWMAPRLV